jgi:serine phosphatase RsbU (regulator of sigma subunit)/PAS domain-containing protein
VRATRLIGGLTITVAALSIAWEPEPSVSRYLIRLVVVITASGFAVLMAGYRERLITEATRMAVLADIGEVAHGGRPVREIAAAVTDHVVPRVASLCVIDIVGAEGELERVAGALDGDPELMTSFLARPPSPAATRGSSVASAAPGQTQFLAEFDEQAMRELAHDDADLDLLRRIGTQSAVIVPLVARSGALGVLTLATRAPRRRFTADDVRYAGTLAGRVALALDNAALSEELTRTERQLQTIFGTVDAAITVRDTTGRLIYGNQAAADLLTLPSVDALRAMEPAAIMERFDVYTEEGEPVALSDLPGSRLLGGDPAEQAPVVVRNVVRATGEERWLLTKATAVTDEHGAVVMAVNLVEDITETKRAELAQRLLARTARTLAEVADVPRTLRAIADAAVPGLADWAGVDLVEANGEITSVAIAHRDPETVRIGQEIRDRWPPRVDGDTAISEVIRTGEALLITEIDDARLARSAESPEQLELLRELGLRSMMIAPITVGTRILGVISFASSTSRRFDARDLELARDVGRQAGIFVNHAELVAEQSHIARTLQSSLIPDALPELEGWTVAAAYRAAGRANEVGGDFYDIVRLPDGWVALIGDVVGKGAKAAALTALARHTLAAMIETTGDVGFAIRVLNRRLREHGRRFGNMCTVGALEVRGDDVARLYSAGHPLPIRRRGAGAEQVGEPGPMLGFLDDIDIAPFVVEVNPGDQLILYTDGVLDAVRSGERFGEDRLLEVVAQLPPGEGRTAADDLVAAVGAFLDGEQSDDIAVLSLLRAPVPVITARAPNPKVA